MKALCVTPDRTLTVRDVPTPTAPPSEHIIVRIEACAINPGDLFFLKAQPGRAIPTSKHDVWGASGAGTVEEVGAGVPASWIGRRVAVYRSLSPSEHTIGLWCTHAQVPVRCCALLPDGSDARDYSGSLVNAITAYSFAKLALSEGHKSVLITAGTSATGIALAVIARDLGVGVGAIVRTQGGLEKLPGVDSVLVQTDEDFDAALERQTATAIFDGVGGALLSRIVPRLPRGSTVYSYGYLGGHDVPLQILTQLLNMKALTLRGFSNFMTPTVQNPQQLDAALRHLTELLPLCKTPLGPTFAFEQIDGAIAALGGGASRCSGLERGATRRGRSPRGRCRSPPSTLCSAWRRASRARSSLQRRRAMHDRLLDLHERA